MRMRAAMALALLLALLATGLAHASRLCGVDRHQTAAASSSTCAAHRSAAAPQGDAPAPPLHPERERGCCTSGTSLAAIPAAKVALGRGATCAALDTAATSPASPAALRALTTGTVACAARDPGSGSGPRRHLVHRILLI